MSRKGWVALFVSVGAIVLIAILGFGAVILMSLARLAGSAAGNFEQATLQGGGTRRVAVVNITGEIHGGESTPSLLGSGGAGAIDIIAQLRQAQTDDSVEAIVLRIDSPGGAVVASDDIASAVRRLKKPVVTSMGDLAASGGYYIASQSDRIVANRGTITGSIGVIAMLFNLEGTAQKLGVEPVVLKRGELKDAGSPFRDFGPKDRAVYQRLLDESYDQFVEVVAKGRQLAPAKVKKIADGRPYSGADAKTLGLVDDFGDLNDAYQAALDLAKLDRSEARLVEYRKRRGFGLSPFGVGSPVDDVKRELGLDVGLKYLYLP